MKVKEFTGYAGGSVRIVLESEHPAELAMMQLMGGCEASCEVHPQENVPLGEALPQPDPVLHVNVTVKKSRY